MLPCNAFEYVFQCRARHHLRARQHAFRSNMAKRSEFSLDSNLHRAVQNTTSNGVASEAMLLLWCNSRLLPTLRVRLGSNLSVQLVLKTRTQGEEHYALDTICNSAGDVVDRCCEQLHAWRVHSHSSRAGDRRAGLPIDQRQKDCCLVPCKI